MATNWSAIWKQAAKAHRRATDQLAEIARHHREDHERLRQDVSAETIMQRRADDDRRASVEQISDMLDNEVELKAEIERWHNTADRWETIAMGETREKQRLYEEIRQLVVERDWLRAGIKRVAESLAGPGCATARRALSDLLRHLHPSR